jgi:hypothetical protein
MVAAAVGCSKSTAPEFHPFVYPLAVGNEWVYQRESITRDTQHVHPDDTARFTITVRVVQIDTLESGSIAFRLHAANVNEENTVEGEDDAWYQNRQDGLYCLGVRNTNQSPNATFYARPKANVNDGRLCDHSAWDGLLPPFPLMVRSLGQFQTDSVWYDPPLLVLRYPLGGTWRYRDSTDFLGWTDKTLTGTKKITTSAGSFDCYRINWSFQVSFRREVAEYFSEKGLIRRDWVMHDVDLTDSGAVDSYDIVQLERITLKGQSE